MAQNPGAFSTFYIVPDGNTLENFQCCQCIEERVHTAQAAQLAEVLSGYYIACYFRPELDR
jgi:hypothetical protein